MPRVSLVGLIALVAVFQLLLLIWLVPVPWYGYLLVLPLLILFWQPTVTPIPSVSNGPTANLDAGLLADATSNTATGAAEVSFSAGSLLTQLQQNQQDTGQINAAVAQLANDSAGLSGNVGQIASSIEQTAKACGQANTELADSRDSLQQLAGQVSSAANELRSLTALAGQIQQITQLISQIASQTNLLALNAAIEAARAGEQGRGFAVVADEVRTLAGRTATATDQITSMLSGIYQKSEQTSGLMLTLEQHSERLSGQLAEVAQGVGHISNEMNDTRGAIEQIAEVSEGLSLTSQQLDQSLHRIQQGLALVATQGQHVAEQAETVSGQTEQIYNELANQANSCFFADVLNAATQAAAAIGRLLEQGIQQGKFSETQLFSQSYQPIAGTDPQKYHTCYDSYSDQVFPAVQEELLQKNAQILYAGAVDKQGYFPTHNRKYSQPLTGDKAHDLIHNRTKRIFADRTGSRCGSHTQRMLLQTYKRDTGEILHDLSVPVYVNGRHWGGFRVGFKR